MDGVAEVAFPPLVIGGDRYTLGLRG